MSRDLVKRDDLNDRTIAWQPADTAWGGPQGANIGRGANNQRQWLGFGRANPRFGVWSSPQSGGARQRQ